MGEVGRHCGRAVLALILAAPFAVRAEMNITLAASDEQGNPIDGMVEAGAQVFIDIYLSVGGADNPLDDLRGLRFDFSGTSTGVAVVAFSWELEPGIGDDFYVPFVNLPIAEAVYVGLEPIDGFIIHVNDEPQRVARVDVVVESSGLLDVRHALSEGPGSGGFFTAGFFNISDFSVPLGNLLGGTTDLTVVDSCSSPPTAVAIGSRYIAVSLPESVLDLPVALEVRSLTHPCLVRYVGADGGLVALPFAQPGHAWGTIDVSDADVVPGGAYEVRIDCDTALSPHAAATTWHWGDVNDDGPINFDDVLLVLDHFAGLGEEPVAQLDEFPCQPNGVVDFDDILVVLDAFSGAAFPCPLPCD